MTDVDDLVAKLSIPVIAAPLFIISNPELVIAQCSAGIVGSFPALNARPQEELGRWLTRIETGLAAAKAADPCRVVAPYAVNLIVHKTNDRLKSDLETIAAHEVPIVITSLSPPDSVVDKVHGYGGLVLHDVTTVRHARRALTAGVDGLVVVAAGAGGHAGNLSPFALVGEVRRFFDGLIALSGAISSGDSILAAQAMGADLAYIGTPFIATAEATAADSHKAMIVDSAAADIVYTPLFTGVHGNYLKPSISAAGLDPDNLPSATKDRMSWSTDHAKPWKDIWGAGHGVGQIDSVLPTSDLVASLVAQYHRARQRLLCAPVTPAAGA